MIAKHSNLVFDVADLLGPRTLRAFDEPRICRVVGDYRETARQLFELFNPESPSLPPPEERMAVCLFSSYEGARCRDRVDCRIAIDQAGHIGARQFRFWMGDTKLNEYGLLLNFSMVPSFRAIHLHEVSIGGGHGSKEPRGSGLCSELFERLVAQMSHLVPQWKITTVAAEETFQGTGKGAVPHLMRKHFEGHHACAKEVEEVLQYVNVYPTDIARIYAGTVPAS